VILFLMLRLRPEQRAPPGSQTLFLALAYRVRQNGKKWEFIVCSFRARRAYTETSMHRFVYRNDRLLPLEEARLSPGQAALLNGWGIFTTMRLYEGRPFSFDLHWKRLMRDAGRIELPVTHSPEAVASALDEVVSANAVRSGCARVYFLYNKVGIWHSDEPFPTVDLLIYTIDLPKRTGAAALGLRSEGRHAAHPLAGVKVTSWLQNVWMLEQAHKAGFEEMLLLNERGEVSECTAANFFCVSGGRVFTPPLNSGCLGGVTRENLLAIGPECGLAIVERPLTMKDVYEAEEAFITSTTREVQAVSRIEDHAFAQAPGPATRKLAAAFSEFVERSIGAAAGR
jgi:branched-chain amino acid aminotransferase